MFINKFGISKDTSLAEYKDNLTGCAENTVYGLEVDKLEKKWFLKGTWSFHRKLGFKLRNVRNLDSAVIHSKRGVHDTMEENHDLMESLEKVKEDVQEEEENGELKDYEVNECTTKSFVESVDVDCVENGEERDVVDVKNTNNESMVDECKESYGAQSVGAEVVPGAMAKTTNVHSPIFQRSLSKLIGARAYVSSSTRERRGEHQRSPSHV